MAKDELVAAEVEKWARTPFDAGQCCRGAGVDCKMLPAGIARDLGFPEANSVYALTRDYDLSKKRGLPWRLLLEGFQALFDRVEEIRPGRLLLLKISGRPAHVAIASRNEGRAWHAQIEPNPFVKEATLRSLLKVFPLHSVWAWRD
jgi:cell wall-associated NlpC family hydrolase